MANTDPTQRKSLVMSVAGCHCPKCREGQLFQSKATDLKHFGKMHDRCEVCGQTFMPEPSFYMGAMFVSYGLQIGLFVISFFLIRNLVPNATLELYMGVMVGLVLITLPVVYRLSRSIWIHLMIRFGERPVA